jgi:site-specific recombinase XerD
LRFSRRTKEQKEQIKSREIKQKENGNPNIVSRSLLTAHYLRHNDSAILYNAGLMTLTYQLFVGHTKEEVTLAYTHFKEASIASTKNMVSDAFDKRLPESCRK